MPVLILAIAALYFFSLPSFIQGGDTSELVTAARQLLVVHPPGYPLWVWAQHLWLKLIPWGTDFWRASLLSSLYAVATLVILSWPLRRNFMQSAIVIVPLALSLSFFEAALLPDVFALHALFTSAIATIYLFANQKSRSWWLPLLFSLSCANHHTTIFMLPLLIGEWIHSDWRQRRQFLTSSAIGVFLTSGLYLSLLSMNPQSAFSWGKLEGIPQIINHVLRVDYGTFQLKAQEQAAGWMPLLHWLQLSLAPLALLIGLCLFWAKRRREVRENLSVRHRASYLGASILTSIGFFLWSNITPIGMGAEVLLRFHVMPLILIMALIVFILASARLSQRQIYSALTIATVPFLFLIPNLSGYVMLRKDSVIQDYATNLLNLTSKDKPSLMLVDNDTTFFALRSLIASSDQFGHVAIASKSMFFHPWFVEKLQLAIPAFQLGNAQKIWDDRKLNVKTDLLAPNIDQIDIFVTSGFQDGAEYKVTFMPVGRKLGPGQGVEFLEATERPLVLQTRYAHPPTGPQHFTRAFLYAQYSHFFLMQKKWEEALSSVPYAYPALLGICRSLPMDPRCEQSNLIKIQVQSGPYF